MLQRYCRQQDVSLLQQLRSMPRCQPMLSSLTSHWHAAGDAGKITVGSNTSIQDGAVIRTAAASALGHAEHATHNTVIGNNVTIGHQVWHPLHAASMYSSARCCPLVCVCVRKRPSSSAPLHCSPLSYLCSVLCRSACTLPPWRTMCSSASAPCCWTAQRQAAVQLVACSAPCNLSCCHHATASPVVTAVTLVACPTLTEITGCWVHHNRRREMPFVADGEGRNCGGGGSGAAGDSRAGRRAVGGQFS